MGREREKERVEGDSEEFIKAGVCRGAHIKRVIESFYEAKNGKSREGVGEADNGEGEELDGDGERRNGNSLAQSIKRNI